MHDIVSSFIQGFPVGCVFALIAMGFVLTYKVSGVFNLAFGAQAYASAALYYELRVKHGWPIPPAVLVAVVLFAPLLGVLLYWAVFRHLRTAPHVARLAVSIGLLLALPEIVKLALDFGSAPLYGVEGIVGSGDTTYHLGSYGFFRDDIATIVATLGALVVLTALFRYTAIGLRMRAVVESPRMTELAGISSDRVSSAGWMLSSLFAGLAGALLGPLYPQLSSQNFFLLIVVAIAAAVFAGLSSLPLAVVGGLGLGIGAQLLARWLPANSIVSQGLRPSLPFVLLFVVLIFKPSLQRDTGHADPLAGVDPPSAGDVTDERSPALTLATRIMGVAVVAGALLYFGFAADNYWVGLGTKAAALAVIFLSFTVFTGMAGQISLAQGSFAAIGGFTAGQLATKQGMGVLPAMVIGVVLAALVGAILAIPALRLGGIYLALATLAFAMFFESVIRKFDWASGGQLPIAVPRPQLGPINFTDDRSYMLLCFVILALASFVVARIRRGLVGRSLRALDTSEVAAASMGVSPTRLRILAFAVSAALAGLGGALLSMREGAANYDANFTVVGALLWLVLVVIMGTRTVLGAIAAACAFTFSPEILQALHISQQWQIVLFGLGAIGFAQHPEGVLQYYNGLTMNRLQRLLDRGSPSPVATPPEPVAVADGAPDPQPTAAGIGEGSEAR
ncbi:MAG TPA: ABC transporter permease [Acidimicrobiales bacterium]|nr:ABC transporter permease [Acidimicrobiales bacterium]